MWKNSKILVAGGSGLIGSNLVSALRNIGCSKIYVTYRTKKPKVMYDDIEYIKTDLLINDNCFAITKDIDYAFLLAASTSGAATITQTPMVHVTPNVIINAQFLEACYHNNVKKVLWLSSTTGYPDVSDIVVEEDMFKGDPFEKYYYVGWMKRFSELLCNMYANKLPNKMPCVVLRPTNIYGPYDKFDPQTSHVLPALIKKVVDRQQPIEVWGDGNDERDVLYVDDMVNAIILSMEKINSYNPINIGCGKTYSVKEILNTILRIDKYSDAKIVYNSSMPTMIPIRKVSIEKAKNLLGFSPSVGLEEGIRKTIDFYRENYS